MSASNQLAAVYVPFALAAVLIGTAIVGSRQKVGTRLKLLRYFLMLLLVLGSVTCIWLIAVRHDYARAAILFWPMGLSLLRLFRRPAASQGLSQ